MRIDTNITNEDLETIGNLSRTIVDTYKLGYKEGYEFAMQQVEAEMKMMQRENDRKDKKIKYLSL